MDFLRFSDLKSMDSFLEEISVKREDKMEYYKFSKFEENRILFTAEHSKIVKFQTSKFPRPNCIELGDRNTDKIAKLMSYKLKSGYLIFGYPRTEVDASRSFRTLGGDEKIKAAVTRKKELLGKVDVKIHQNEKYLSNLQKYHSIVEKSNPKIIASIHGIQRRHKNDVVFGLGENSEYVGGAKEEKRLMNILEKNLEENGQSDLKFRVSKKYYTGKRNFVLHRNILEFNRSNPEKRYGMQIEFNRRTRVGDKSKEFIKKKYQIVCQIIADSILEWGKPK